MKKAVSIFLTVSILLVAFGAPSCRNVSQEVKILRALASAPVALKTAKDIVAVLGSSNDVTPDLKSKVDRVADKTEGIVEKIAADIRAGRFDEAAQKEWDRLLTNVLQEVNELLPLIKSDIDPRASEWIAVGLHTVPLFKDLIATLKPPPMPAHPLIQKDAKQQGGTENLSIGPGEVSAIVSISTRAAIKFVSIQNDTNAETLWAKYDAYKAEYHAANATVVPVKKASKKQKN